VERIVFLDRKTCPVPFKIPRFLHQWQDHELTPKSEIAERLRDATIAITNKVPLRANDLIPLRSLRCIAVAATGVDIVDLAYCRENNITVCNVPAYTLHSVPEHVFMMILALRRNLFNYRRAVQAGMWQKSPMFTLMDYSIQGLAGSTLGIIGYGKLGQEVEKIGKAFGMDVLIAERKHADEVRPGRRPFNEVLGRSDVITLHAPLTAETRQLIGSTELTRMKETALLINTARGGLVDELALAHALRSKLLGGAALDVLSEEPPSDGHPLIGLDLPHLLITPHIGWASQDSLRLLADEIVSNIEAFVAGYPKNVVS
jgi:glycerate dehydrogenase